MDILDLLDIALAVIGFGLLFYGFSRNNRKLLLVAGIMLFLTGTFSEFIRGLIQSVRF